MDNNKNKCSFPEHSQNEAKIFCQECKIYMCNKCEKTHQDLFKSHNLLKIGKNNIEIFTGFCKEPNHINELKYFCKNHNKLCCAQCIIKIKDEENGQHSECNICVIKDIENLKKNNLKENIIKLENLSKNFQESINELKKQFELLNDSKENLKTNISKIFTKIRSYLNEREDELLGDVDKQFNELFIREENIKKWEKLPEKINISLEIGKKLNEQWENNKLNYIINNCLNVENNIKEINIIDENLKKIDSKNLELIFEPEEKEINKFVEIVKNFGKISIHNKNFNSNFFFEFLECPKNIQRERKYKVTGEKNNIVTKIGGSEWVCIICKNEFKTTQEEYIWKMKIKKSYNFNPMVGVSRKDFDINKSSIEIKENPGWFYNGYEGTLFSGPPHNYYNKYINLKKRNNEVIIIMNMKKRSLKFIIDNEDKGDAYSDIPLDKPIYPSVFLYHNEDSVEFLEV